MTMAYSVSLSIILVNWNSAEFLRKCLHSLYANARDIAYEILVVENASFDACERIIQSEFPAVRFIQSEKNLGFARANNIGCSYATGKILLFLNPDTEVLGAAIERMLACFELRSDVGVVGPKLLNSDFTVQTSCLRSFPTILNRFMDCEYFRGRFPAASLWGNGVLFQAFRTPVPVEAISGACLMIRHDVFERVGQFSPEYFMYAEDTDLCYRVQKAGWKNYYVGDAMVVHHGGQSSSLQAASQFSSLMMKESLFRYFQLNHGAVYATVYRIAIGIAAILRLSILWVAGLLPFGSLQNLRLTGSRAKWVSVLRWALGRETWVKEY
jgi:GT2 family glycosyltransferase